MAEEGRLARAMAKAGAADKLSATARGAAASAYPAAAMPAPEPIDRARGHWGLPGSSMMFFHDRMGMLAAQIRSVRARLLAVDHGRPPQVITVSSGSRGEGKTTVCLNLAAALSEVDPGRVLMVDGDLLRPALHEAANVRISSGINEVLSKGLDLSGSIYETAISNLDLLPARATVASSGYEPHLHQRCSALLALLKRHYHFIVIDTPPVLSGSQACTFGRNSDGILLVARLEKTPRHIVKRAMDELTNAGGKMVGCILTHQKHHVPNLLYRFVGSVPSSYYHYADEETVEEAGEGESSAAER